MKFLPIFTALVGTCVASTVMAAPHAYLYKDNRIMAQGGANIATGGYSSSLFHNPAGLSKLPTHHGMIVELFGVNIGTSENAIDMFNDISDAADSGQESDVLDVLNSYAGTPVHVDFSNYSSVSYNHGDIAWSVGLLAATDINATAYPASFDVLNIQARAYGGLNAGASYILRDMGQQGEWWQGNLSLGLGAKLYTQSSYEDVLDPNDIIDFEQSGDDISDRMQETSTAFAFDLGAIYHFDLPLSPSVGMSIMNIGDLDFDGAYGSQPMTVNIGFNIEPELAYLHKTTLSLDYVDVFNANQFRFQYPDGTIAKVESADFIQNLRIGARTHLWDNTWSSVELATGLYQGNWTAGVDMTLSIVKLSIASYAEELGPSAGDLTERRYSVNFGIGW